ncbi:ATP-binding cassette domain-containing protein [bacterium]|nr:ATP-binding cassette domain-containing protein [bacterium]
MSSPLHRLVQLLWLDRSSIFLLSCYALGAGLLALALPLAAQALVNSIVQGLFWQPLLVLTSAVFAGLLLSGVLKALQLAIAEGVQQKLFARLGLRLTELVPRFQTQAFRARRGPEELNKFFEIVNIQKSWHKLLIDVPTSLVELTLSFAFLLLYGTELLSVALLCSLIAGFLIILLGWGGLTSSKQESKLKYQLAGWLEQLARSQDCWKLFRGGERALQRSDNFIYSYLKYRQHHFSVLLRQLSAYYLFNAVVVAGVLGYGGFLVIERQISVGQLVAAELVVLNLLKSAEKLVRAAEPYFDLLTGLDKLGALLEIPAEPEPDQVLESESTPCHVQLRGVGFAYPDLPNQVLSQADLELPAGSRISLLAPEGGGRSTLAQLCVGLLQPQSGLVEVDGREVARLQRGQLAWLHPGHDLLDASVEENILMGREFSQSDLRWALEMSGLNDHLSWLPQGLRTELCWAGRNLSSSQVARLQLARVLVGRPRLLILDHDLAALDPEGRKRVFGRLFDRTRSWTLLNLICDPEALALSQRIFWLQDGEIIDLGTPTEAVSAEISPLRRRYPWLCQELTRRLEARDV